MNSYGCENNSLKSRIESTPPPIKTRVKPNSHFLFLERIDDAGLANSALPEQFHLHTKMFVNAYFFMCIIYYVKYYGCVGGG